MAQQRDSDELDASLHELLDDLLALADTAGGSDLSTLLTGDAALLENEGDSERSSLSTGASDQSHCDDAKLTPALRVKKRRRHEVLRWKETVSQLETKLKTLQRRQAMELLHDDDDDDGDTAEVKRRRRLRVAAKQQIQGATRAKLENAKLCDAMRAQAEFGNAVQKALSKQRHLLSSLDEERFPCAATTAIADNHVAVSARERAIYDRLSVNVDTRTTKLGPVLGFAASDTSSAVVLQACTTEARVLRGEHESVCVVEFASSYVIPFDFKAGAHVIWTQVLSRVPQMMSHSSHTEVVAKTDNVILTKHSATTKYLAGTESPPLATEYSVSKRFAKPAETAFAWESLTESQAGAVRLCASSELPAINYVEEGRASVGHVHTHLNSSAASVVQARIRLTLSAAPDSSDPIAPGPLPQRQRQLAQVYPQLDVDALSKCIISVYQKNMEMVRCLIESTLLDDARRRSLRAARED